MGAAVKKKGEPVSDLRDEWLRRATASAVTEAKKMMGEGALPPSTPLYRMSDVEWGWIVSAAIFGWINVKAQEATAHGLSVDSEILHMPGDPSPWERGAIEAMLGRVGELSLPWDKPIGEWDKDQIVTLLWKGHGLIDDAMSRRDRGKDDDTIIPFAPEGNKQPTRIKSDEIPF